MSEKISIGNILKNMRNSNNKEILQVDIGRELSLADNTISSYERENSQPDFKTIVNYARICGYDIKIYNEKTKEYKTVEEMSKEL